MPYLVFSFQLILNQCKSMLDRKQLKKTLPRPIILLPVGSSFSPSCASTFIILVSETVAASSNYSMSTTTRFISSSNSRNRFTFIWSNSFLPFRGSLFSFCTIWWWCYLAHFVEEYIVSYI